MIEHSNFIKDTFVKGFKPSLYIKTVILSILSGVLSFIYITFVNSIMVELIEGSIKFKKESMILLVFTLLCFIWTRKMLSTIIINFSQAFLWDIRLSLIQLTLKSNFEYFKSHQNKVYASLVGDVPSISQASLNIIHFFGRFCDAYRVFCIHLEYFPRAMHNYNRCCDPWRYGISVKQQANP